jgi:hypothetical protein
VGNTTFTVHNDTWSQERTAPAVVKGIVLTPEVTQGTDGAWAGVQVTSKDAGDPAPSGIWNLATDFCTLDGQWCMYITAQTSLYNQDRLVLQPAAKLIGYPAGTYYLQSLSVEDFAHNLTFLTAKEFGGDTDFSTLFPAGHTIEITD